MLSELADDLWSMMTAETKRGRVASSFHWGDIKKFAPDDDDQNIKSALEELIRHGAIDDISDQLANFVLLRLNS